MRKAVDNIACSSCSWTDTYTLDQIPYYDYVVLKQELQLKATVTVAYGPII